MWDEKGQLQTYSSLLRWPGGYLSRSFVSRIWPVRFFYFEFLSYICSSKYSFANGRIVDFAVPADHRVKLKDSENRDKYLGLAREQKKQKTKKTGNMKVTVIPIVIGVLVKSPKGQEDLEIRGRVEAIQTRELVNDLRILGRVLETWGETLSLRLQWKIIG